MEVRELIRGVKFEFKDSFIKRTFEYEGHLHIVPNGAGLEYLKMFTGFDGEGDFRYVLIKWD